MTDSFPGATWKLLVRLAADQHVIADTVEEVGRKAAADQSIGPGIALEKVDRTSSGRPHDDVIAAQGDQHGIATPRFNGVVPELED